MSNGELTEKEIDELLINALKKKTENPPAGKENDDIQYKKLDNFFIYLPEQSGGEQLILDYKAISSTEYYAVTIGYGPHNNEINNESEKSDSTNSEKNQKKVKIRFFKLTFCGGNNYNAEEFLDPEEIVDIMKLFNLPH